MKAHYIHTDQLVDSRNNVVSAAEPLSTFISWVLFAHKDRVSTGIGVIEAKAKLVIQETGMEHEGLVDYLVSHMMITFLSYKPLSKTYKAVLLGRINSCLDRLLSNSMRDKKYGGKIVSRKNSEPYNNKPTSKEPVVVRRRQKAIQSGEASKADNQWSFIDICQ
jgi:hypothetical protein